jgi:hypothetical protein
MEIFNIKLARSTNIYGVSHEMSLLGLCLSTTNIMHIKPTPCITIEDFTF